MFFCNGVWLSFFNCQQLLNYTMLQISNFKIPKIQPASSFFQPPKIRLMRGFRKGSLGGGTASRFLQPAASSLFGRRTLMISARHKQRIGYDFFCARDSVLYPQCRSTKRWAPLFGSLGVYFYCDTGRNLPASSFWGGGVDFYLDRFLGGPGLSFDSGIGWTRALDLMRREGGRVCKTIIHRSILVRVIPDQHLLRRDWSLGKVSGHPCSQIFKDFEITNILCSPKWITFLSKNCHLIDRYRFLF